MKHFQLFLALALGLALAPAGAQAQANTDSLRRAARTAEQSYERTVRWLAPSTFRSRSGRCDETVGRFCLTFDSLIKPPSRAERPEVHRARTRAIEALRALTTAVPGDRAPASALVRLLVEAHRPEDAVAAADAFDEASHDALWADWLTGFALHAAARDSAAEVRFRHALSVAPLAEREAMTSLEWLVSAAEQKRLRNAVSTQRAEREARFWRLADPMWLTRANEVWVEHMARHVQARLLAQVPQVTGMLRWDRDLDQLTVRYGAPISREREVGGVTDDWSFIEHFDTAALAYAPESLEPVRFAPPIPGAPWALKSPSARTSHAPPAIASALPLEHQLTRIPRGDSMLVRLDTQVPRDSAGPAEAALIAWSWERGTEVRTAGALEPGKPVTLQLTVPRDSAVYSAEVFDPVAKRFWRARYLLEPLSRGPLQVSDVMLAEPVADTAGGENLPPALTTSVLPRDRDVGVVVHVAGVEEAQSMAVEVSFAPAAEPSLLARAGSWLGQRLGLAGNRAPSRVRWQGAGRADGVLAVNLRCPDRAGLYYLQVTVSAAGGRATARRLVRVMGGTAK